MSEKATGKKGNGKKAPADSADNVQIGTVGDDLKRLNLGTGEEKASKPKKSREVTQAPIVPAHAPQIRISEVASSSNETIDVGRVTTGGDSSSRQQAPTAVALVESELADAKQECTRAQQQQERLTQDRQTLWIRLEKEETRRDEAETESRVQAANSKIEWLLRQITQLDDRIGKFDDQITLLQSRINICITNLTKPALQPANPPPTHDDTELFIFDPIRKLHPVSLTIDEQDEQYLPDFPIKITDYVDQRIYIRPAYPLLYQQCIELLSSRPPRVLILGTPGIGKSVFLYYFIWRQISEDTGKFRFICFINRVKDFIYVLDKRLQKCFMVSDSYFHKKAFAVDEVLYLIDTGGSANRDAPVLDGAIIVVSSPDPSQYRLLLKNSPQRLFMPTFSEQEVTALATINNCDREKAVLEFNKYGGVPRAIFDERNKTLYDSILENKAACYQALKVIQDEVDRAGGSFFVEASHKILHYAVTKRSDNTYDFENFTVAFASQFVANKVMMSAMEKTEQELSDLVLRFRDFKGPAAAIYGFVFELFVHIKLSKAGTFDIRYLGDGTGPNQQPDRLLCGYPISNSKVTISSSNQLSWINSMSELNEASDAQYRAFKQENQPTVDACFGSVSFVQITVSPTHSVNLTGLKSIKNHLKHDTIDLIFVVPNDVFDSGFQSYQAIPDLPTTPADMVAKLNKEQLVELLRQLQANSTTATSTTATTTTTTTTATTITKRQLNSMYVSQLRSKITDSATSQREIDMIRQFCATHSSIPATIRQWVLAYPLRNL